MSTTNYSSDEMQRYFNDPEYRRKKARGRRSWSPRKILAAIVILAGVTVLGTWYTVYVIDGLPSLEELENPRPELSTKIYGSDGELLDEIFYKNRSRVALSQLPPGLIGGLVATEDKEFFNHWGLHVTRIGKAFIKNVIALDLDAEGASTLTMQLSRNLYLKWRDRNIYDKLTRKIREAFTSVQIERNFTKDEILELYLNVVWFGRGSYGIESAARTYFGKSAAELQTGEYTLLIGMLRGPSYYDPINHPERALGRRDVVLGQMIREGLLSRDSVNAIKADSLQIQSMDSDFRAGVAPHFVELVRRQLQRKAEQYGFDIYRDGLRVYTTVDSRMQRYANRAVEEHLPAFQALFDSTWNWAEHPDILEDNIVKTIRESDAYRRSRNADQRDSIVQTFRANPAFADSVKRSTQRIEVGFVAIDPHTGGIMAMVGGRNFRNFKYGLNHITQIRRQPGSAFKPFVYTVALDNGYPACYELLNQPVTIPMPDGTRWTPSNYDKSVGGKYTLRDALKLSINLVTVRAILEIAPAKQVADYAQRMGIRTQIPPYESIALGSVEVVPLDLVSSYGVFANEGVYVSPVSILRIEDKDGNVIERTGPEKREVLSKETAYLMTDLLRGVVNGGTATRAIRTYYDGPAAGKTGTTNDYGDAWFVGFTPRLVAGAWVGFDDNRIKFRSSEGQGGRAAAPMWGRFMQYTYDDPDIAMPLESFNKPDGIIEDTICVETKKKAREYCPDKATELFNAKYPIGLCDKHTSAQWNEGEDAVRKRSKITW